MISKNKLFIVVCVLTMTISVASTDTQPQESSKSSVAASPRPEFLDSVENVFHFLGKYIVGKPVEWGLKGLGSLYDMVTDPLKGEKNRETRENIYKWSAIGLTTAAAVRGVYSWWEGVPFWGQPGKSWWKKKFPHGHGPQQTMILN